MEQLIVAAHLLIALAIVGLIMLQQGKGADMGASFGAGGSQTLFGSEGGGNVLTKATAWLVVVFFVTSFSLALLVNQRSNTANEIGLEIPATVDKEPSAVEEELPVVDEAPAATTPSAQEEIPAVE